MAVMQGMDVCSRSCKTIIDRMMRKAFHVLNDAFKDYRALSAFLTGHF